MEYVKCNLFKESDTKFMFCVKDREVIKIIQGGSD